MTCPRFPAGPCHLRSKSNASAEKAGRGHRSPGPPSLDMELIQPAVLHGGGGLEPHLVHQMTEPVPAACRLRAQCRWWAAEPAGRMPRQAPRRRYLRHGHPGGSLRRL
jgi:hypothetical protein